MTPHRRLFHLRFLLTPFLLSVLDMFVTLSYQSDDYWAGDRSQVLEGNPVVWLALRIHPILIIPGLLSWYGVVWFLLFKTPSWIAIRIQTFLVLAHLIAIGGWLIRFESNGGWIIAGVSLAALGLNFALVGGFLRYWNAEEKLADLAD